MFSREILTAFRALLSLPLLPSLSKISDGVVDVVLRLRGEAQSLHRPRRCQLLFQSTIEHIYNIV